MPPRKKSTKKAGTNPRSRSRYSQVRKAAERPPFADQLEIDADDEADTEPGEGSGATPGDERPVTVFDQMADDSYVLVHRLDPTSKRYVLHGRLAPAEATEEYINERWGGGTWRVQERRKDISGIYMIGRTAHIEVNGPYRPNTTVPVVSYDDKEKAKGQGADPTKALVPGGSRMDDIIGAGLIQLFQSMAQQQQMMSASMQQQMEASRALLTAAANKPTMDWSVVIPALAPLAAQLFDRSGDKSEMLEMIRTMTDVFGKATSKSSDVTQIISAMRDLMDVKDMLGGGGGDSDPLMGSIPKLVEVIAESHQASKGGAAASRPAGNPGAAPTPAMDPTLPLWQQLLLRNKNLIVRMAQSGQPADFVAEMAHRLMPPNNYGIMAELVRQPDAAGQCVGVIPELAQYPNWTAEFFEALRGIMLDNDDDTDEAPPEEVGAEE